MTEPEQPLSWRQAQAWKAIRKARADLAKTKRSRRGKRPGPPITGVVKRPEGQ